MPIQKTVDDKVGILDAAMRVSELQSVRSETGREIDTMLPAILDIGFLGRTLRTYRRNLELYRCGHRLL